MHPLATFLRIDIVDTLIEAIGYDSVDQLHLAIGSRMGNGYILDVDVGILTEFPKRLRGEI